MHEHASVASLMIVVGIAFFIPILLHRLHLKFIPVVVAEILAGIIIGQSGFNLIQHDPWLEILSMFGLIYLMFLSGVEIDFSAMKKNKNNNQSKKFANPLILSLLIFSGMLVLAFGLSKYLMYLGLIEEPFLMTIVLSTISLGVVVPVLKEKKVIDSLFGQTILLIAVVSDFITMLIFVYYLSIQSDDSTNFIWISLLFLAVFIIYFIAKHVANGKIYESLRKGTTQLGTRGAFALILFFVVMSETLGAENILGAFLAGVVVSLLAPKKEFVHQLDSFGYGFLIPIFFVMVGVNLDVKSLFNDKNVLILLPLLFLFIYLTRMIPAIFLKKYFSWKETIGSGVLLGSTMSLAIVVSSIAFEFGFISQSLSSAIILISILTCFVSPILFQKFIPKKEVEKKKIGFVGSNRITIPVSLDLKDEYRVQVYGSSTNAVENQDTNFPLVELSEISLLNLKETNVFDNDLLVIGTGDDNKNIDIAKYAKDQGIEKVFVRVEHPDEHYSLVEEGFMVFSTIHSTRMLLKAMIDNPGIVQMISDRNDTLQEISISNSFYHERLLRDLPFLGDALIVRITRGETSIIPHGDTNLMLGDRLLISGSVESIQKMKDELD